MYSAVALSRASGFSERQARVLILVLEHSGVCLPQTWKMEDAAIKGLFLPGDATQNMFSMAGTPTSQDGRNMVYLSSGLPTMQRNEVLKEELLGHALLFDLNLKYQHELLPGEGRAVNTFIFRVLLGQPYPR